MRVRRDCDLLVINKTDLAPHVGAAKRLLSLGHTDTQRILDALAPEIVAAVEDSSGRGLDQMTSFAPLVDVLAADHERADRRLFIS